MTTLNLGVDIFVFIPPLKENELINAPLNNEHLKMFYIPQVSLMRD